MKTVKITPKNITKLKKNEIFVFGSNLNGAHVGGAAKLALDKFGAIMGEPIGLQGQSYAIPTLDEALQKQPLWSIQNHINNLLYVINKEPKKHFLLTEIGCGIAGFTHAEIAPMFRKLYDENPSNLSMPQSFVDLFIKKGYKVTDSKMQCSGYQYEIGKTYEHTGTVSPCNSGFHYCAQLNDCFEYYSFDVSNRVFEIIDGGKTVIDGNKSCTSKIEFLRELSWLEVLELLNIGRGNSGRMNAGNRNAGYSNAGYSNAGNSNAGYSNAGNYNAGNSNAGYSNAGNRNAGNSNAGNYNAGNRNAGYSNAGNDNAGAFNNLDNQPYILFNKPSKWTYDDFIKSDAFNYLQQVDTTLWIPDYKMTDEEKDLYPYYVTTSGYVRNIPYKEAFGNAWNNWNDKARKSFQALPNFDAVVFFDITGIDVTKKPV